ncbi:flavin prenyltransferase UbiX [Lactobacillus nasalidis]|uniref:Flavin prenyltransferase UbiX n=1 Tax=Lactobacillus nasalidis TaxID=2797258 RepID=A0ABQ3W5T1_9LACO|nr:UbiX family flavin prenyltransferase [Lactobacillus nasalidis]GHV97151.1 flavin prenyltransferase UbiX [Lactobacillus nasalidis]GHV99138.1 flavin prenyltransferase UbiX [Lactobacillus nasalidis]GHW01054.1 flavin prenyltransferase UbiX [Lactobacillus nasalidis]
MKRIVVAITGASGSIYGIDLLKKLQKMPDIETWLVMSDWAKQNIVIETDYTVEEVASLADQVADNQNLAAAISSGSFQVDGMVVVPASMKTVAGISLGLDQDLIMRASGVMIKEQRKLILMPRETPLSAIHLENLLKLARLGVQIIPPIPSFYSRPETIQDLLDQTNMRVLDNLGISSNFAKRWGEKQA